MNDKPIRDYKEMQRRNGTGLMESMEVRQIINMLEAAEATIKQEGLVTPEYLQSWIERAQGAEATIKAIGKVECIVDKIRYAADSLTERQYVIDLLLLFDEESGALIKENGHG